MQNATCTPFSHRGTPFLMPHGVQGTPHFITQTLTTSTGVVLQTYLPLSWVNDVTKSNKLHFRLCMNSAIES